MRMKMVITTLVLMGVLLSPLIAVANLGGAVSGHTGAPAVNGRTCTACHSSQLNSGPGSLKIKTPLTTYAPGSVIPVTISLEGKLQHARNGYQMAAYTGTTHGSIVANAWTSPDFNVSRVISDHIGHARGGNMQSSWKSYFTTPAQAVNFTFYAAGNAANGNGRRDKGDLVYATKLAMTPGNVNLTMKTVPVVGVNVRLDLDSAADGNKAYVMGASLSDTGFPVGGKTVPLGVDFLLILSINNLVPTLFQNYQGILNATGRATATLAVPSDPGLKGLTVHHAFVVLDATKPGGVGTVSNGLPVTLF